MPNRPKSPHQYVEDPVTGCWIWQRALNNKGYGVLTTGGRKTLAHRHFYERARGRIPEGLELDHECDTPACVNPAHLTPKTHAENLRRGRSAKLSAADVAEVRRLFGEGKTGTAIAPLFDVTPECVRAIRRGARWSEKSS